MSKSLNGRIKGPIFLFAYDHYYPAGGLGDLKGTFNTIDDTLQAVRSGVLGSNYDAIELVAIIDRELKLIGDINPTGDVHFEPADKVLER